MTEVRLQASEEQQPCRISLIVLDDAARPSGIGVSRSPLRNLESSGVGPGAARIMAGNRSGTAADDGRGPGDVEKPGREDVPVPRKPESEHPVIVWILGSVFGDGGRDTACVQPWMSSRVALRPCSIRRARVGHGRRGIPGPWIWPLRLDDLWQRGRSLPRESISPTAMIVPSWTANGIRGRHPGIQGMNDFGSIDTVGERHGALLRCGSEEWLKSQATPRRRSGPRRQ